MSNYRNPATLYANLLAGKDPVKETPVTTPTRKPIPTPTPKPVKPKGDHSGAWWFLLGWVIIPIAAILWGNSHPQEDHRTYDQKLTDDINYAKYGEDCGPSPWGNQC